MHKPGILSALVLTAVMLSVPAFALSPFAHSAGARAGQQQSQHLSD